VADRPLHEAPRARNHNRMQFSRRVPLRAGIGGVNPEMVWELLCSFSADLMMLLDIKKLMRWKVGSHFNPFIA